MSRLAAWSLVFFTSAAVLVLEILAGRMMAPYVGVTLESFTGIIGTVLAGIALGNWLGGRAADRYPPERILPSILVVGGLLAILTSPIVSTAGPAASTRPLDIVTLATLAFFAPAAVLSAVTPTVAKIRLHSLTETGSVVGRLSAIATAGAIFGTFITGFILVAAWPSRTITIIVGIALIAAGLAMAFTKGTATATFLLVAVLATIGAGTAAAAAPIRCEHETAYYCVNIDIDPSRPTGRILWLDTLRHSYVDLDDSTYLGFRYARLFAAVLDSQTPPGPLHALSIGGGGFTFPRYLLATHPGTANTVLELDPALIDIAQQELGLDSSTMDIRTGDARITLQDTPTGYFDVVIGDAFGGPAVPWHLTTREFVTAVAARLRPGGLYLLNLIDYPPLGFARAEAATLAATFDHVAVVAPPDYIAGMAGGNFVLVASDDAFDLEALRTALDSRNRAATVVTGEGLAQFFRDAAVLRDDFAPVDQLITS